MKNTVKRKVKSKVETKERPHVDVMNDPSTFGTDERKISALEHATQPNEPTELESDSEASVVDLVSETAAEIFQPKFKLSAIDELCREVAKVAQTIETNDVDVSLISEEKFRTRDLSHRYEKLSVKDLSKQLRNDSNSGLLHPPLIYKSLTNELYCVSGWKRIAAAKELGIKNLGCKVIEHAAHVGSLLKKYGFQHMSEVDDALKAVFSHIVYSEAIHSSPLKDMAVLNYFHQIKVNHGFGRNNFRDILQFLGLERKSPKYNDLLRLWYVACEPISYKLVTENKVRLRVFKKNFNISVMHHHHSKAQQIAARVDAYINRIRKMNDPDEAAEAKPFELDGYKDSDIEEIILYVDQPKLSPDAIAARKYRSPRKIIKKREDNYEVQAFKIDFGNRTQGNARQIVETLFVLEHLVNNLREYVYALGGIAKDSTATPTPPSHKASAMVYGEKYFEFIRQKYLWDFCNIVELSQHLRSRTDSPISPDEWKRIDNLPEDDRKKELVQLFREYAIKRDANQVHREHVESNATDEAVKQSSAPLLKKEEDIIYPRPKKQAKRKSRRR